VFLNEDYSIVPIRMEDRYDIMKWRNEQVYHLRQDKLLTKENQDKYFNEVVSALFEKEQPNQILFSYVKDDKCIGYGGLVHINWIDRNAEISFVMETSLEEEAFEIHWTTYLDMIEEVAFYELGMRKIFTYAFDLRPKLYTVLENLNYIKEASLKEHAFHEGKHIDVIIHSKIADSLYLRTARSSDVELTYKWATDSTIRMFAFNKEKIEWENHKKWYNSKIYDPNCEYYILNNKGVSKGSIRFDIDSNGLALISYLIDPAYQGKGYGKDILDYGVERLKVRRADVKKVIGFVQSENGASIRIFEKLGFYQVSIDHSTYRFEKPI
jgi:RimJ/RimL family protein N-acetyltransferase